MDSKDTESPQEMPVPDFGSKIDIAASSPADSPKVSQRGLSYGSRTFSNSRESLRESFSDVSAAYRHRLHENHVAVMPDGKFTFEYDESGNGPRPGEGLPRRHPLTKGTDLLKTYHEDVTTLHDSFVMSVERSHDNPCFGTRVRHEDGTFGEYRWETYGEVFEKIKALSTAMIQELQLERNASVGLYSVNRAEWCVTEQACFASSLVTVPLYDTLGDDSIAYICKQTGMHIIFTSLDKLPKLQNMAPELSESLKYIVSFDPVNADLVRAFKDNNIQLLYIGDLLSRARELEYLPRPPAPQDLCTICYTSGTTGWPKGVMLPHSALLADASACLALCGYGREGFMPEQRSLFELRSDDVHISYLPLAHIFERIVLTALITVGASIGFYQGDTLKLMDDIAVLRPTIFVSVPRLFNRVYDKVLSGVKEKNLVSQFLFNMAYASKIDNLRQNGSLSHPMWDWLVFRKIRARLGGRIRAMLSGSAPISPEVMEFLRVCFSCEVYEGYGQTETSAGTCLTIRHDWTTGHVGIPAPCNEIKLVDVAEMGYTSQDKPYPRGEICVRGPNCFVGYYHDPEKTAEALDADGWVHSGDIGEWDARGRLCVIDRKKNLFKLSQGEYISPERVEAVLTKSPYIAQAYLHGDSLKSSTVAIIVPDQAALMLWLRRHQISEVSASNSSAAVAAQADDAAVASAVTDELLQSPYKDICANSVVRDLLMREILKFGRKGSNELKGFEIPRAIYVEPNPFSLERNLLTATFKLKRNEALHYYSDRIHELYASIRENGGD